MYYYFLNHCSYAKKVEGLTAPWFRRGFTKLEAGLILISF